ncbi:UxaA family hydrolase [Streptomyces sp. NBC_00401]|uniref:UxaA family hydrolase n=1 Tax=Streptomyces sp. NBC_00401 TaxID=2975738 RepID=UPI00338DC219
MTRLCLHPDTGAVVLVALGCESFDRVSLANHIRESGRPVRALVIQETGVPAPPSGRAARPSGAPLDVLKDTLRARSAWSDLTVGTICGGSDGTSGLTANPAVGRAFDRLTARGARCVFKETGELIRCEHHMEAGSHPATRLGDRPDRTRRTGQVGGARPPGVPTGVHVVRTERSGVPAGLRRSRRPWFRPGPPVPSCQSCL